MTELIINGTKKNVPNCWEDVTLRQFDKLSKAKDDIEACAILIDEPVDKVRAAKDIEGFNRVLIAGYFLKESPNFPKYDKIGEIAFKGNTYTFKEMTDIPIGQYQSIRILANMIEDSMEMYAKILATYLQPLVDDAEYDNDKAMALVDDVYKLPAMDVIGSVGFFLSKLTPSKKSKRKILSVVLTRGRSILQGLRGLRGSAS